MVKNLPAGAGDVRDLYSIPGSERSPREGRGNPLQYSCLQNPMDRGAWRGTVHGVSKESDMPKVTKHRHICRATPEEVINLAASRLTGRENP